MALFSTQLFILTLALVGVVIIIAALISGLIDCAMFHSLASSSRSARFSGLRGWTCRTSLSIHRFGNRWLLDSGTIETTDGLCS
jgi:hypothetical protein